MKLITIKSIDQVKTLKLAQPYIIEGPFTDTEDGPVEDAEWFETEGAKIQTAIDEHMKKLAAAPDYITPEDFEKLDEIGERIEDQLYDAGFQTAAHVRAATDKELLAIKGVGKKRLAELRQQYGEST